MTMSEIEGNRQKLNEIIKELLQSYGLSGMLSDVNGTVMLSYFTDVDTEQLFFKKVNREAVGDIRSSFFDYDATDVIDRDFDSIHLRTVAVRRSDGRVCGYLFLIDHQTSERMDGLTRVFKDLLGLFFDTESELTDAHTQGQRGAEDADRLSRTKKYYRYLSMLVDDMNTGISFQDAADDIIKRMSICIDFDTAALITSDGEKIETVNEYSGANGSREKVFKDARPSDLPFLDGRSYTISADSLISDNFRTFMQKFHITAGIFSCISDGDRMTYLCLLSYEEGRIWHSDDIDFTKRACSILRARVQMWKTQTLLQGADDFMKSFYDSAQFAVAIYGDSSKELIFRNKAADEIFADPMDEELFRRRFLIGDSVEEAVKAPKEFAATGSGDMYMVYTNVTLWQDSTKVDVFTITDITKQKQYQKKIRESADLDDLTGLYNRHRFHLDFETCINDAVRSKGQGTLIFVDLDDFNALNDGLGHVLADRFLKKAAWSVQQAVKKDAQCYRIGGDQFAVLVPYSGYDNVEQITENIRRRFEKPFSLDDDEYYCTACMGIVHFPEDGDNEDLLLQRVDYALHQAKSRGKNKTEYFTDVSEKMPADRMGIEKALREAVADDCREFEVYYQPVVDIKHGEPHCCGAEALVRWNSKKLGFMTPDKFISLAEYLGLIVPIDEHVLIEAARHCRYWNDYGHPDYRVNVNLSVVQLLQNDIVDVISNAIKITGINPDNLVLEVTEGLAINDMDRMKDVLTRIHDLGVRLALDDFGTGYSSLSRIKDFPLDEIKIDRCFVKDIDKDNFSDAFVRSVSQLADAVNMNVVVEGVERDPQKKKLEGMNVSMIQGFLYDKPLTQEDFDKKYM